MRGGVADVLLCSLVQGGRGGLPMRARCLPGPSLAFPICSPITTRERGGGSPRGGIPREGEGGGGPRPQTHGVDPLPPTTASC